MIVCTLNGKKAYPLTTQNIKITMENEFVKSSGAYTYDITFPLAIAANREVFGNVQRLDVHKKIADFEKCFLYAANRLVMSGKGIVTAINKEEVKLQITAGKSRVKYNSKFEKHFIDEIDYPEIVLDSGLDTAMLQRFGFNPPYKISTLKNYALHIDLSSSNIVGQKGVAILSTIHDESNSVLANRVVTFKGDMKANGHKEKGTFHFMYNLAPMPYLFYILKKVIDYEGYHISANDLDKDPWNRLVIVSGCRTGKIKDALPHWTVYKFLDEFRKLFNASFIFDETAKTVKIKATNELLAKGVVTYEAEDDFNVEHDEEGSLENLVTSNVSYAFDDASDRDFREFISQDVFKDYETIEYGTRKEMLDAIEKMTAREQRTKIFKQGGNYYIYAELPVDGNPENENLSWQLTQCGFFNPIIRDIKSDNQEEIAICPAAMIQHRNQNDDEKRNIWGSLFGGPAPWMIMPSVTNEKQAALENMQVDDDGDYYYTVQDAMQGSSESKDEKSTDDTSMPVAFQADCVVNLKAHKAVKASGRLDNEDLNYRVPVLYTDYRWFPTCIVNTESGSLSLENTPVTTGRRFGNMRGATSEKEFKTLNINAKDEIAIKFLTDDVPDPTMLYMFWNKKYICSKIEMTVKDDGIEKEKTGYFYEF